MTVALPAARSLLINNPAPGRVLTDANTVPDGMVSVIVAGRAGTTSGILQVPAGAGPAATVTGVPAILNAKLVPATTPLPATLQTCSVPWQAVAALVSMRHGAVERVAAAAHARAGVRRNGCQRENVSGKLRARAECRRTADLEIHAARRAAADDHRRITGRG